MNPAFAYVYDDFLSDRRYEKDLSTLETELSRRGIEGRVVRLAMFRSAKEMVSDLVKIGVKNVVFVGNDDTLQKMMWFLPDLDVTVGFLPLAEPSAVARMLGIPLGTGAIDVLAARLVEVLDVGRLNDRYFLTEVVVPSTMASLNVENRFRVSPSEGGAIAVRNLGMMGEDGRSNADPKDGLLTAVVQTSPEGKNAWPWKKTELKETRLFLKTGSIESKEPIDVFVDGHALNGFQFQLSIVPSKLKIITGREKKFKQPANSAAA